MTQRELREKIRVEERRKCRAEIEDLKAKNRRLLHENINLRTANVKLRTQNTTTAPRPDWFISLMRLYGL